MLEVRRRADPATQNGHWEKGALGVIAYWFNEARYLPGLWQYTAYALALLAVALLIQEWFRCWVTEIAVTNRRVIYKKGLVRRQTNEMNMDKVESVKINQSILGRMLDYGDVTILGTGEGFRRQAVDALARVTKNVGSWHSLTVGH